MIFADRLTLAGDKTFQNCKIYNTSEQEKLKVPNIFEIDQIYFEDGLGHKYLIPDYMITTAEFINNPIPKMALNNKFYIEVNTVNVSSDITHSPALIIPNKHYEELGVPILFSGLMQFTFFDRQKVLYITSDTNICLIRK